MNAQSGQHGVPTDTAWQSRHHLQVADPAIDLRRPSSTDDPDACACGRPLDDDSMLDLLRHGVRRRVHAFAHRELRPRALHEIAVIVAMLTVAVMLAAPALVPLVLALQGQRP